MIGVDLCISPDSMLLQIGSDLLIHMGHPEEALPGLYSLRNSSD